MKLFFISLFLLSINTFAKIEWDRLITSFPEDEKIQEIISPAMSYRTLLEWGNEGSYKCLIYRLSSRERPNGILYLGNRTYKGCSLAQKDQDKVLYSSIKKIRVKLTKNKNGQSYQVIIVDEDEREEVQKWEFPFSNTQDKRWKGISLTLNKKNKRVPLLEGKVCSYFDTEKMKVDYSNCQQCTGRLWTPVLNRFSASYPVAICGASRCGERNQNPCLKMTSLKSPVSCEEAERLVFCQSGKSIICLGSGFLQCR